MTKKLFAFLTVIALSFCAHTYGQDILIRYDLLTGKTKYFSVNTKGVLSDIDKPFGKKNKKIVFSMVNVNPFAYSVSCQIAQNSIQPQFDSTHNLPAYVFGNLSSGNELIKNLQSSMGIEAAQNRGPSDSSRVDSVQLLGGLLARDLASLHRDKVFFRKYLTSYDEMVKVMCSRQYAKDTIVKKMDSIIRAAFDLDMTGDLIVKQEVLRRLDSFQIHYNSYKKYYTVVQPMFSRSSQSLIIAAITLGNAEADSLYKQFADAQFIGKLYHMDDLLSTVQNASFEYRMEDVLEQDYANVTVTVVNKRVNLEQSFTDLDSGQVKTLKYRVVVKGEFVVRSSIGISFPTLFGNSTRYEVRDNKVVELKGQDNFIPNLTTFLNFYPFRGVYSNFGGVLGFSYPLSGDQKNISILLGVSESFGDKNAVVLNAGLAFSQTNRLGKGYTVGQQVTDANVTIPTDNVWKVGAFIGLSISFLNK